MNLYSRDFSNRFGNELTSVVAEFVSKICEAGLSVNEVLIGIEAFKHRAATAPWSVNPAEFIAMCHPTPEQIGLPSAENAYRECCAHGRWSTDHKWSHPAVFAAGRETGWFELNNRTEQQTWPLFKRNYAVICRRAVAGESFDNCIPKALPAPTSKPTEVIKAKAIIADFRNKYGLRTGNGN
ncbi:replication protein P [Shewanella glacialipiscicola]|uniref:replication protein P n=1 Tax=Shewanella glacialipiscicola TaxID=614069 RepID=UPI003D78D1EE